MDFKQRIELDRQTVEQNQQEINDLHAISRFFERHEELVECDAAVSLIRRYMQGSEIDDENLEISYTHTELFQKLPRQTILQSRTAVEEKILTLLQGTSPGTAAHEQAKFKYKETSELREQLAALEGKRDLQQKTPAELKALIQASKPTQEQDLPELISRAQILHMMSAAQIRFLVSKYSMAAVTKRLNER
jgi:hypothetical protein